MTNHVDVAATRTVDISVKNRPGAVTETTADIALTRGRIAGAGLDVHEHEAEVREGLRKIENVTLLPNMGASAFEMREVMGITAFDSLEAAVGGETPLNLVN